MCSRCLLTKFTDPIHVRVLPWHTVCLVFVLVYVVLCLHMALSAMCFSIPSFNLCHTLLLAIASVIAFTCSSCALLLIYWAPCPIVIAGSLSFSPRLSLSLSPPMDVAEYVFLSPCLPVWLVLCPCLFICCSCLAPCSSILAVLAFLLFIYLFSLF